MRSVGGAGGLLRIVEAAYRLDGGDDEWVGRLIEETRDVLDGQMGAVGYRFRITADGAMRLPESPPLATAEVPAGFARAVRRAAEHIAAEFVPALADTSVGLATGSQMARRGVIPDYDPETWDAYAESVRLGAIDHVGATALDASGEGLHIVVPRAEMGTVSPRESARWRRVLAHVAAGLRLRLRLSVEEAVLDPGGRKVLHAEGPARSRSAREALRQAALAIDAARGRAGDQDPEAALREWSALVSGRWSIVDRFDRDGRRYLVARRNDPEAPAPRGLSQREAQVAAYAALGHTNKHIAYVLGLHASTVSCHLRAAMRRIGARNHAELAEMLRGLAAESSHA